MVFDEQDMLDKAISTYKKAVDLDSKYSDALFKLGYAYARKEEFGQAVEYYKKVLVQDPKHVTTYYNMATAYYHLEKYTKAIEAFEKYLKCAPGAPGRNRGSGYNTSPQRPR